MLFKGKWNIRNRILRSKGIENKPRSFFLSLSMCAIFPSFLTKDMEIEGTEKSCVGRVKQCRNVEKTKLNSFVVLPRDLRLWHMSLFRLGGAALVGRLEEDSPSYLRTLAVLYSFVKVSLGKLRIYSER